MPTAPPQEKRAKSQPEIDRLRKRVAKLQAELDRRPKFGLAWELQKAEHVLLPPGQDVRAGSTVRDRRSLSAIQDLVVESVTGDKAVVASADGGKESVAVKELCVVRRFDEPSCLTLTSAGGIRRGGDKEAHLIIEAENYHALQLLACTHKGQVDVIYIDPPYNTGKDDFMYNDRYVNEDDKWAHSKWLEFMKRRLELARKLLAETGVIVVHIDEHELDRLYLLLVQVFRPQNDLGRIIWNKRNPKGDSQGVAIQHESVLCFAKSKAKLLRQEGALRRKKPNAVAMLRKAKALHGQVGKRIIPPDVKEAIGPFGYSQEQLNDFEVEYTLEMANREFAEWLKRQDFSEGEKAYKNIDAKGRVWQSVSMAWPNNKKAPDEYFIPLLHSTKGKPCPVPAKGWRNPPETMERLLEQSLILFGPDETTQPRRIYYLEEHMGENTPSILDHGASDDKLFEALGVKFDNAKPVAVAKYLLSSIVSKKDALILDFFAGSGTTLHATLELNAEDDGTRRCILATNNEVYPKALVATLHEEGHFFGDEEYERHGIVEATVKPRIEAVVTGKRRDGADVAGKAPNGRPRAEGLEENIEFLRVDYLEPEDLASEPCRLHALLWVCAGGQGAFDDDLWQGRDYFVAEEAGYAVFLREFSEATVRRILAGHPGLHHVFFTTRYRRDYEKMARTACEVLRIEPESAIMVPQNLIEHMQEGVGGAA